LDIEKNIAKEELNIQDAIIKKEEERVKEIKKAQDDLTKDLK
jgi:hypothetical protein